MKRRDSKELRKTKIKAFMNNQDAECYIFGDKVVFVALSKKEPVGILIENVDIAKFQKTLFEQIWKS